MKNAAWLEEGLFTVHGKDIEAIFRDAVLEALRMHKRNRKSVTALLNGAIVVVTPDEILPDEIWVDGLMLPSTETKGEKK